MEKLNNDNTNNEDKDTDNKEENLNVNDDEVKSQLKQLEEISNFVSFKNKDSSNNAIKDEYKFWDTQPVTSFKSSEVKEGPINNENDLEKVRKEPYSLPKNFIWRDVDINKKSDLKLVRKHFLINIIFIYI